MSRQRFDFNQYATEDLVRIAIRHELDYALLYRVREPEIAIRQMAHSMVAELRAYVEREAVVNLTPRTETRPRYEPAPSNDLWLNWCWAVSVAGLMRWLLGLPRTNYPRFENLEVQS